VVLSDMVTVTPAVSSSVLLSDTEEIEYPS